MARRDLFTARLMAGASLGLIGLMTAGAVHAQGDDRTAAPEVSAIVVTAPKGRAADVAPVKSSLLATEPQALISRKEIEEVAPRIGDYTTTAILAPSMTSSPNPNGPGSTDGAKISMRGFKDGEFNVTYDGIAWGDANGPSHHANSFFPSSTIGGVVIDRGPGDATELGQANFGGQINLFSLPFEDKLGVRQTATYASFNTWQSVTTLATGPIKQLHDANFVFNYMSYGTDGYLTYSPSKGQNIFLKGTLPITDHFKVTGLYTWNGDDYHQGDSNSVASVAQTALYGKRFALSNDPTKETYTDYNYTKKTTDFEYVRLNGDFGHGLTAENTVYSYAYTNNTLSGADDSLTSYAGVKVIINPSPTYPAAGSGYSGTKQPGLPGYYKLNQYRITGDILRFDEDFGFGTATIGAMYEQADTHRSKLDIDLLTRQWDYREKSTKNQPVGISCAALGYGVQSGGQCQVPLYINNQEYSGWHQYQVFAQVEWRPLENLRITPGVKYVDFNLFVRAPDDAKILQPVYLSPTFTKVLPFLTVNYRIMPTWAVYAQYAQGFLVPDVSVFNVKNPKNNSVVPQESTNYQIGTVYSAGKLSFDGDIYYIDFKHKIQSVTITDPTSSLFNETITTNSGGATYTGAEVQATYVLPEGFSLFANYSRNNAVAKDDKVNPLSNGFQLAGAPRWTAAAGLRFERGGVLVPDGRLVFNVTDKWIGSQTVNVATATSHPAGIIKAYSDVDMTVTYSWRNFSIEGQVINLAGSHAITAAKGSAYDSTGHMSQDPVTGAANQLTYDIGRSYQVTLKAAF